MKIAKTKAFVKNYHRLPKNIQNKTDKQIIFLSKNLRHSSIRAKKLGGFSDVWEGRVDRSYRFTFIIETNTITLLQVGHHDEGLGKK